MSQTSTKKEKEVGINNHDDFNQALLECQAQIESEPYPMLEVAPEFFKALTKGRDLPSITYGNPGVRIFKIGTMDDVLDYEDVPADVMRERELKRINAETKK
jgi:hypothetical protein